MGKRRKFSRWRRLPGVYRFGDEKPLDPNLEPQRLSLYVSGVALDRAAAQASRLGFENVQEYCAELLLRAVEAEHVREHVAEVEARRGTLEGLHEIADDPEYLAELSAATSPPRDHADRSRPANPDRDQTPALARPLRLDDGTDHRDIESPGTIVSVPIRVEERPAALSPAAAVVLRHAGQGMDDPNSFLPSLRRGDPVPPSEVAELAQALHDLEREYRDAPAMDRGLTFALHRLAFESQILHTDAWPGVFDLWTIDMLRAVQEAVERILSGRDIRYYPGPDGPAPGPPAEFLR